MIHDIPLGRTPLTDNAFSREQPPIMLGTSMHQADPIFIYEVMALTCGIQTLYDDYREVWLSSGIHSAGNHLQQRQRLWNDVTTLQKEVK